MRRYTMLLTIVAVVLLGGAAIASQPLAVAQEATPAGEEMEGLTFEPVTFAFGVEVQSPSDLVVARVGVGPGSGFPIEEGDPSTGLLLVESGQLTVVVDGPMTVTRSAGLTEAVATAETSGDFTGLGEDVAAGQEVTLEAGDAAYIPSNLSGEVRNDGDERAVALAFLVIPSDEMTTEATPAP